MAASVINPNDASAMQEDVNQFLKGLANLAEIALERQNPPEPTDEAKLQPEELRIQMGRQVVYGHMAKEFRNDLSPERMEILMEAFQQPVAEGVDRSDYERRIPAIEVKKAEETLFRQERDGVISVNQFGAQLQQELSQPPELDPRAEVLKDTAHAALVSGGAELSKDKTVVVASESIGADYPDGIRILAKQSENGSLGVFQLDPVTVPDQTGEYSKSPADPTPVLATDSAGQITYFDEKQADVAIAELSNAAQGVDQHAFVMIADEVLDRDTDADGLTDRQELAIGTNPLGVDSDADGLTDSQEISLGTDPLTADTDGDGGRDAEEIRNGTNSIAEQSETHSEVETQQRSAQPAIPSSQVISVAAAGIAVTSVGATQQDSGIPLQTKEGDTDQLSQLSNARNTGTQNSVNIDTPARHTPAATAGELRDQPGHSTLGEEASRPQAEAATKASSREIPAAVRVAATEVKNLPEGNAKQLFKSLVVEIGKQSQQISQQALDWVASRPEWKRNQDVAQTAQKLFDQHYKQTGETSYQAENYNIKLKGTHHYEMSDLKGKKLMTFEKGNFGRLKVLQSNMSVLQYNDFNHARQTSDLGNLAPRGTREAAQSVKTNQVMQTAQQFLQKMGVSSWNPGDKGNYALEGDGKHYLKIDSKADGRGTILKLEGGQLTANLQSKDFSFFKKVDQAMHQRLQDKVDRTEQKQSHAKAKEKVMVLA